MSCTAVTSMLDKLGAISAPLELSADRKTAARVVVRKSKAYAEKNAFGLTAGPDGSCGSWVTDFCVKCYAQNTETQWPSVAALVGRNLAALRAVDGCHRATVDK